MISRADGGRPGRGPRVAVLLLVVSYAFMVLSLLAVLGALVFLGLQSRSWVVRAVAGRGRALVLVLFCSTVASALLRTRLDEAMGIAVPRFRLIAARLGRSWKNLALRRPVWASLSVAAGLVAILVVLLLPQLKSSFVYESLDFPLPSRGRQQLIAQARGPGVPGFSRWRVGDQVHYIWQTGYTVALIDGRSGQTIWEGPVPDAELAKPSWTRLVQKNHPEDLIAVFVGHHTASASTGQSAVAAPPEKAAHVLILAQLGHKLKKVAEAVGPHVIVALNPNLAMRAYLWLNSLLPELLLISLITSIVLGVAGFIRVNHGTTWSASFRYALLAAPALGIGILLMGRSPSVRLSVTALAILAATYVLYRNACVKGKTPLWPTAAVGIGLVYLTEPGFVARNIGVVRLLASFVAFYLVWRAYSALFGASRAVSFPGTVFLLSRLSLLIVCYVSTLYVGQGNPSPWTLARHWDAEYYLDIASSGYRLSLSGPSTANFFPFYPFLIATARLLFPDPVVAGVVVSNLAFFASLCLLYRFATRRWGERVAQRSVALMAVGPASFYFSAIYTESVFLLCCLVFFALAQQQRWFQAGLAGMFAALARPVGVTLLAVAVWEYFSQINFKPRKIRLNAAWLALIPLGYGLFSFILYGSTGDPLANVTAHRAWRTVSIYNPFAVIRSTLSGLDLNLLSQNLSELQLNFLNGVWLLTAVLVLLSVVPIWARLGGSYAIFTALGILVPLCTGTANSAIRYAQVLFPATVLLAIYSKKEGVYVALVSAFVAFMTLFAIIFVTGFWMV